MTITPATTRGHCGPLILSQWLMRPTVKSVSGKRWGQHLRVSQDSMTHTSVVFWEVYREVSLRFGLDGLHPGDCIQGLNFGVHLQPFVYSFILGQSFTEFCELCSKLQCFCFSLPDCWDYWHTPSHSVTCPLFKGNQSHRWPKRWLWSLLAR